MRAPEVLDFVGTTGADEKVAQFPDAIGRCERRLERLANAILELQERLERRARRLGVTLPAPPLGEKLPTVRQIADDVTKQVMDALAQGAEGQYADQP